MKIKLPKEALALFTILACIIYFPIFYDLDGLSIRLWDESRNAENALEMSINGNWIVSYYEGIPEMWNSKPPFLFWLQAIFLKIFGYSELSIRLPSALATVGCIIVFNWISVSHFKKIYLGAFFTLIYVTSPGIIRQHVSRTGDFDALLLFFVLTYSLFLFRYLEENSEQQKNKYLLGFTLAAIGAGLTKGIAAFLITPGLFLYIIYIGKAKEVLTTEKFYFSLVSIFSVIMSYYLLRESLNPGYLVTVLNNEITGRYLANENNYNAGNDYFFYTRLIINNLFNPWVYIIPVTWIILFFEKDKSIQRLGIFSSFISICFLSLISYSKSKYGWYDAQFYPFGSILVAIGFYTIFSWLAKNLKVSNDWALLALFLTLSVLIFYKNYKDIMYKIETRSEIWNWREEQYGEYLRQIYKTNIINFSISSNESYNGQIIFYKNFLNKKGKNVQIKKPTDLIYGDTVVFCYADNSEKYIQEHYNFEQLFWGECQTVRILTRK